MNFESPLRDIRQGPFQTAVMTRGCGLASTPRDPDPHHDKSPVKEAGFLLNRDVATLSHMALSSSPMRASVGMATINSLIDVDKRRCVELNAGELLFKKGVNKKVAIIGHFPFVSRLRTATSALWVIEQNPQAGDFAEAEAEKLVPQADVVGINGTAFTNHTIEHLLSLCHPDAYAVILGGTTPLSPILFDYGVSAVSGTLVTDPEMVLFYVS